MRFHPMGLPSFTKLCLSTGTRSWVDRRNFLREIQALLGSLRGDAPAVQKDRAAFELAKLSQNSDEDEYMQAIWLTNGIPLLVALVREGTEMQKDHATIALFYASHDTYNQKEIVTAGGISALLASAGRVTDPAQAPVAAASHASSSAARRLPLQNSEPAHLLQSRHGSAEGARHGPADESNHNKRPDGSRPRRNLKLSLKTGGSTSSNLASGGATELQKQMATNTLKLINRRKPLPGLDFLPVYNLQRARGRTRGADG